MIFVLREVRLENFSKKCIIRTQKFTVKLLNCTLGPPNCTLGPPNLGVGGPGLHPPLPDPRVVNALKFNCTLNYCFNC